MRPRVTVVALAVLVISGVARGAHAGSLRAHEREFVEFEMTIISVVNNCHGYEAVEGALPKWAYESNVRSDVIEAVHDVLQTASGASIHHDDPQLVKEVTPIIFDTLATMRDTLKKRGACDLLGGEAVKRGFLLRD